MKEKIELTKQEGNAIYELLAEYLSNPNYNKLLRKLCPKWRGLGGKIKKD